MQVVTGEELEPTPTSGGAGDFVLLPDPTSDCGYFSLYSDGSGGAYVPLSARQR